MLPAYSRGRLGSATGLLGRIGIGKERHGIRSSAGGRSTLPAPGQDAPQATTAPKTGIVAP
jgi:hypothetical protein